MRFLKLLLFFLVCILLTGCITITPDVPISHKFYEQTNKKLGICLIEKKHAEFITLGDNSLLSIAVVASATDKIKAHFKTIDISEFSTIKSQLSNLLEKKGFNVIIVNDVPKFDSMPKFTDPNTKDKVYFYEKNLMPLKEKYGVDFLVLLKPYRVGGQRMYNGVIPKGDPYATFGVLTSIVNLNNNQLSMNQRTYLTRKAEGAWDEPPNYPGLTNSFFITMEQAKEGVLKSFTDISLETKPQNVTAGKKAE